TAWLNGLGTRTAPTARPRQRSRRLATGRMRAILILSVLPHEPESDRHYHMKVAISSRQQAGGLRQLKKLETMRHVQLTALGLFEKHGFDTVTIEEIAKAARVSAPTIYRYFSTKEGLVLWDDYDPLLLRALAERLRVDALGDAI